MQSDQMTVVGTIGAPYGIRGWLWLYSETEKMDAIIKYQPWFISSNHSWQPVELQNWRYHKDQLIIKLKNIEDRNQATLVTNCKLAVPNTALPGLEDGVYYWRDLIGCSVLQINGAKLGVVNDVMDTGANEILVISDAQNKEHLIPFITDKVIQSIDLSQKQIVVDWDLDFLR